MFKKRFQKKSFWTNKWNRANQREKRSSGFSLTQQGWTKSAWVKRNRKPVSWL